MEIYLNKIFIGIDPDCHDSGLAIWDRKELLLFNVTFFRLFDILKYYKDKKDIIIKVVIEAGWLHDKSNWHKENAGERIAARIGKNTGANHETGRKIVELCEYLGLEYELRKPITSKFNAKEFKMITKYDKKTNQEQRDAAMLVYKL